MRLFSSVDLEIYFHFLLCLNYLPLTNSSLFYQHFLKMADLCLLHTPRDMTSISAKIKEATEQVHTDCVLVLHQLQDSLSGTLHEARLKAARQGHLGLLKYLYRTETSWFLCDHQGPLCQAMIHGHIHVMNFLIASGANAEGQTPLILAIKHQDVNMANAVLLAGANANGVNRKTRQTALMETALNGCLQIAILLIEAGADVNIFDMSGHTALMLAVRKGHLKIGEILIKAGADVDKFTAEGLTALLYCTLEGNEKGVRFLVQAGADVNMVDRSGHTALMMAVHKGNLKIGEILIKAGADVDKICSENHTALLHCASEGNEEGVRMLVQAGADVNNVGEYGDTALIVAARNGDLNITNVLIEAGADVNKICVTNSGDTALIVAVRNEYLSIIEALIEAGADVNKTGENNKTALSYFALNGNKQGVRLLLRSGAKVNIIGRQHVATPNIGLLLKAAGQEMLSHQEILEFPTDALHHHCRKTIRRYLLKLDRHENLFLRIPQLGLPSRLAKYLLFDTSLDDNDA